MQPRPRIMHQPAPRDDAGRRTAMGPASVTVAQLAEFDEIIDVRSEAEYAEDHIPGAINCPVLDDAERVRVGTIYKKVSSFEAKKIGAALVSRNIGRHIEERFLDRPRSWRPLVYCWRGGSRSGAFAQVLQQIDWRAGRLDGGYKAYRRAVIADLQTLPAGLRWRAVCGLTGCGKSRLLAALAGLGAQVLDLEGLAAHRGSVLGTVPDAPQPTQKMFETLIWNALRGFSPAQPVYVEAESRKIGDLRVPESLIACMWQSECVRLEAGVGVRVALLKQEYTHFLDDPQALTARLERLVGVYGRTVVSRWKKLAQAGRWDGLVEDLLGTHYDPAYTRSTLKHYTRHGEALLLKLEQANDTAFTRLARRCLERTG